MNLSQLKNEADLKGYLFNFGFKPPNLEAGRLTVTIVQTAARALINIIAKVGIEKGIKAVIPPIRNGNGFNKQFE